jgi:hypothetical protein
VDKPIFFHLVEITVFFLLAWVLHIFGQRLTRRIHMRMSSLLASTVLATVLASSAAFAAPITFTWNPNGTSPTPLSSPGSQFSSANMTVADYATIDISDLTHVTESGWLAVTSLNTPVTPGFVNGTGSGIGQGGVASPYQLYFQFSSTSHLTAFGPGILVGAFDTLSYTLYGDVGGTCTFSPSGPAGCLAANQIALATGNLAGGTNNVSIIGGSPAAHANVDITVLAGAAGFFVNPSDLHGFIFETSFTNTDGVVSNPNGPIITINGGGGNVDMLGVPEPLTLSVFGAGLAGAAALRRRKAKKA